ncbi:MAG: hypothetical protein NVV62_07095 [Terricaulis sp.]|nr:hypothetical protein [Terricaulis sp.]
MTDHEETKASLLRALPGCIEGLRLSAQLSSYEPTESLKELENALTVAWVAASRLALEQERAPEPQSLRSV